jgi:hypothetical protein
MLLLSCDRTSPDAFTRTSQHTHVRLLLHTCTSSTMRALVQSI